MDSRAVPFHEIGRKGKAAVGDVHVLREAIERPFAGSQ